MQHGQGARQGSPGPLPALRRAVTEVTVRDASLTEVSLSVTFVTFRHPCQFDTSRCRPVTGIQHPREEESWLLLPARRGVPVILARFPRRFTGLSDDSDKGDKSAEE